MLTQFRFKSHAGFGCYSAVIVALDGYVGFITFNECVLKDGDTTMCFLDGAFNPVFVSSPRFYEEFQQFRKQDEAPIKGADSSHLSLV